MGDVVAVVMVPDLSLWFGLPLLPARLPKRWDSSAMVAPIFLSFAPVGDEKPAAVYEERFMAARSGRAVGLLLPFVAAGNGKELPLAVCL